MRAILMAGVLLTVTGLADPAGARDTVSTESGPVIVERVVSGLDTPWAVAFLPGGDLLVTERDGALLRIPPGGTPVAVGGVPDVRASGQGGLLDVVLDPSFAETGRLYLSYAEPVGVASARTAVARAVLDGDRLRDVEVLFRQSPAVRGGRHFGSRIVVDGTGHLFVTLGERGMPDAAQDPAGHLGKVIRIRTDGQPASPRPAAPGWMPELWSIGHRNAQGAALDERGRLWTVSHGARGGDEVNRPEAGRNYGWPVISYGRHYSGGRIGAGTAQPGMEQPVWYWDPSIAPSGMAIYSGALWPGWAGDIFVGSLRDDHIARLDRDGDRIVREERLFDGRYGRIRDVREGPDGALWFLSEGDGALYRVRPAP